MKKEDIKAAREESRRARALTESCRYGRRKEELEDAERMIGY